MIVNKTLLLHIVCYSHLLTKMYYSLSAQIEELL